MVEARGVEPLSENASKGTSPGADACSGIAPVFLRHRSNVKPAGQVASVFMVRSKLCARTSASKSTPRIRAEALPEGTGHGSGRGQNSVIVVL